MRFLFCEHGDSANSEFGVKYHGAEGARLNQVHRKKSFVQDVVTVVVALNRDGHRNRVAQTERSDKQKCGSEECTFARSGLCKTRPAWYTRVKRIKQKGLLRNTARYGEQGPKKRIIKRCFCGENVRVCSRERVF